MRFVIKRVKHASVTVDGNVLGKIEKGFMVLIGVCETDDTAIADKMVKKLIGLRIFEDENGKTNLDLHSVGGALLLISQFTLYANCKKGNRPSFVEAAGPELGNRLYEQFLKDCEELGFPPQHGVFGADMKVASVNDGPVTLILDTDELMNSPRRG